jgi:hypothetical protein
MELLASVAEMQNYQNINELSGVTYFKISWPVAELFAFGTATVKKIKFKGWVSSLLQR